MDDLKDVIYTKEHLWNFYKLIIEKLLIKGPVNITVEPVKKWKSQAQLGFFFGIICKDLKFYFLEHSGYSPTNEELKDYFYKAVGETVVIEHEDGTLEEKLLTLSKMSVEQCARFIINVLNYIDNDLPDCRLSASARYCWAWSLSKEEIQAYLKVKVPKRDEDFLRYQRKFYCSWCGRGDVPCEVHHIKDIGLVDSGIKTPDWYTLPLCYKCHRESKEAVHSSPKQFFATLAKIKGPLSWREFFKINYVRWRYGDLRTWRKGD